MRPFDLLYNSGKTRKMIEELLNECIQRNDSSRKIIKALDNNEHANQQDSYLIAFNYACNRGHYDLFNALIGSQIIIDNVAMINNTPIRSAAHCGSLNIINALLTFKEVIDSMNSWVASALDGAAKNGHNEVVKLLLNYPQTHEDIDLPNLAKATISAFINGHSDVVLTLIQYPEQKEALEEFLNVHLASYEETQENRVQLAISHYYYKPCDEHPMPVIQFDTYKKACDMINQQQRILQPRESEIMDQMKRQGVIHDDEEATRVCKVLNILGTKLNKSMTSSNNAVKISLKAP